MNTIDQVNSVLIDSERVLLEYIHSRWNLTGFVLKCDMTLDIYDLESWHQMIRGIHHIKLALGEIAFHIQDNSFVTYFEQPILRIREYKVFWQQYIGLVLAHEIAHGLQACCAHRRDIIVDQFGLKLKPDYHHHGPVWSKFYLDLRTEILKNYFF